MSSYRLDRTAFKAQTAEEAAASHSNYYQTLTWQERLHIANYLNSIAYNYPEEQPPRMDKTVFSKRSREVAMGDIFKEDFRDFISSLNECDVRYILVGGYSVILHGYARTTGDMDVWVDRSQENYKKIVKAFLAFGMPVFDMTEDAFLHDPKLDVYTFGRPPSSIDIMVEVKGLNFNECFPNAVYFEENGLWIRTIYINDLIKAKKAAGRSKDFNDLENLHNA